jgi:glycosyltransferase involved in cell wall biosynthesis
VKIVYLYQYFSTPEMSGDSRCFEMARRWAEAGHEVHVVTSSRTSGTDHSWMTTQADGAHIHWRSIPYNNGMSTIARIKAFLEFAWVAGPRARSLKGDVVFATSTPLTIILPALYATLFRKTPIVFEVRDLWPEMPIAAGYLRNPLLKLLARALERLAYKSSRRIVALSEGMAAGVKAANVPADKIVVAPNSCDVETLDLPSTIGIQYRESQSWLGARPFVVYCGTIGQLNDVSYLARLAAGMRARHSEAVFGIYGTGKEEAKVRAFAKEAGVLDVNFFMMGSVPKKDVPAILSAASVAASVFQPIPEMQANSANKFFDGLAAAKPVVINYGGWQAEILQSTGAGIVLDSLNIERAADALDAFLNDPERLAAAGVAGRRLASEQFSRDRIARLVLRTVEAAARREPLHAS